MINLMLSCVFNLRKESPGQIVTAEIAEEGLGSRSEQMRRRMMMMRRRKKREKRRRKKRRRLRGEQQGWQTGGLSLS